MIHSKHLWSVEIERQGALIQAYVEESRKLEPVAIVLPTSGASAETIVPHMTHKTRPRRITSRTAFSALFLRSPAGGSRSSWRSALSAHGLGLAVVVVAVALIYREVKHVDMPDRLQPIQAAPVDIDAVAREICGRLQPLGILDDKPPDIELGYSSTCGRRSSAAFGKTRASPRQAGRFHIQSAFSPD